MNYMMTLKKCVLLCVICFLLFGCSNEYENFEQYNLKKDDITTYTVHYDDGFDEYAIANISDIDGSSEIQKYGLFYKTSEDNYILMDEFSLRNTVEDSIQLYNNELFVLTKGEDAGTYVYKLDKEKFTKKSIQFKANDIIGPTMLKDIKDGKIYLFGMTFDGKSNISANFKCSLDTYECEQIDGNN